MGRRIFKKVYSGEILEKHLSFVYDGYKLLEERNALDNNAAVRKYVWQSEALDRDVPLTVYDAASEKTYYYHTDANKNVTELSDESGNVVAHYEYSPFGSLTKATGDYAASNPFRFSSEYYDEETGLVYYNYRYYNPELGRWISRDPIEEEGGCNLYIMLSNRPWNSWDSLGQLSWIDRAINVTANFAAGMGDNLMFGFTSYVRKIAGIDNFVDKNSSMYLVGDISGTTLSIAIGGALGAKKAMGYKLTKAQASELTAEAIKDGAGREFSHWIPNRILKKTNNKFLKNTFGKSIFNGNYVSIKTHALTDPYRYRFLTESTKDILGSTYNAFLRQLMRIPYVYDGMGIAALVKLIHKGMLDNDNRCPNCNN